MEMIVEDYGKRIYYLLRELNAVFNRKLELFYIKWGLTASQIVLLSLLRDRGELKISEIASGMSLADSNVSGIVDRLEKAGFVERARSEEDRRIVKVRLTGKVKEMISDYDSDLKEFFSRILSDFSPGELNETIGCMEILKRKLDQ